MANRKLCGYKWCYRCDQDKPALDFPSDASRNDGLNNACRSCHNERRTARRRAELERKKAMGGDEVGGNRDANINAPTAETSASGAGLEVSRVFSREEVSRILSLDDLLAFFKVDTAAWEVGHYRVNKWEQHSVEKGIIELYQVRATLVHRVERRAAILEDRKSVV